MKIHCLFEQSGTFKNEFKKLGYEAYDYDIQNQFGETDYQVDLFREIEKCYSEKASIFDKININDIIISFFPCTKFSTRVYINLRTQGGGMKDWNLERRLEYSRNLSIEQSKFYNLWCEMFLVVYKKNLRMIVENPYLNGQNYLYQSFPIKPTIIDYDRRNLGDTKQKSTAYWFVNIDKKDNKIYKSFELKKHKQKSDYISKRGIERSLINPEYAKNFILKYILEE